MSEPKSKYVEQVMSLFGLRHEAGAGDEAALAPAGGGRPDGANPAEAASARQQTDGEAFDQRLQELSCLRGAGDSLVTGRVHMINIEKVRERLGDRWPKFADRVHEVIKAELKMHLSAHDLFRRVGDDSYVIVFGDCPEAEARLKVALMSEQILEKLLGEAEAKDLQSLGIQRFVTNADGSVAAEALESTEALVGMLDEAQRAGQQVNTFGYDDLAAGRRALTPEEVAHLMGGMDLELEELENDPAGAGAPIVKVDRLRGLLKQLTSLEDAMRVQAPAFTPPEGRKKPEEQLALVEDAKPILAKIQERKKRAEQQIVFHYNRDPSLGEREDFDFSLNVDFAYQPMWHAPSNKVGIYVCKATLRDADGQPLRLADVDEYQEAEVFAIVDRLALHKVREDLNETAAQGIPNIIMIPVHFSTLHRHGSRMKFLELCSQLPGEQRKALSWEIVGSHIDSWSLQLRTVIRPMAPFGRVIFLRLANLQANFSGVRRNMPYLRAAGVHAVGVDVATLRGAEPEKLRLLESLAVLAEKNGLRCYGHGFQSLSMTICAVCMGYQHVSGPAIAAATQKPEGIRATRMENIYGRMLFKDAVQAG